MKYIIIFCLAACCCFVHNLSAQQDSTKTESTKFARHAIYVEGLGNGILGSLNYDFRVWKHLSFRFGLFGPVGMINGIMGSENNYLEIGAGAGKGSYIDGSDPPYLYFTGTVAYRYQPQNGGLFFKVGLTPYYKLKNEFYDTYGFKLWGGIALGYTF